MFSFLRLHTYINCMYVYIIISMSVIDIFEHNVSLHYRKYPKNIHSSASKSFSIANKISYFYLSASHCHILIYFHQIMADRYDQALIIANTQKCSLFQWTFSSPKTLTLASNVSLEFHNLYLAHIFHIIFFIIANRRPSFKIANTWISIVNCCIQCQSFQLTGRLIEKNKKKLWRQKKQKKNAKKFDEKLWKTTFQGRFSCSIRRRCVSLKALKCRN